MKTTIHRYVLGDSLQSWSQEDCSIDLIVTSPPSPMIGMWDDLWAHKDARITHLLSEDRGVEAWQAMHQQLDQAWAEAYRVLRPGCCMCINISAATRTLGGIFQLYPNHSRILQACLTIGFHMLPSVIWRKPINAPNKFMGSGMLPAGAYVTLEHEHILIMRKGEKRSFAKEEKIRRAESALFWEERNLWFSDLWQDLLVAKQKISLTRMQKRSVAFPLALPYRLIMMYSMAGDVVFDPFAGLGTTSLASLLTGRNSVSVDIEKKLVEVSAKTPSKRDTKDQLNQLLFSRIKEHMQYVQSKDMLFFRYRNLPLGIPVKTMQEKQLTIYPIKSISRADHVITAKYRKVKTAEIEDLVQNASILE